MDTGYLVLYSGFFVLLERVFRTPIEDSGFLELFSVSQSLEFRGSHGKNFPDSVTGAVYRWGEVMIDPVYFTKRNTQAPLPLFGINF